MKTETILKELDNYDWEQAFEYAVNPEAVPPGVQMETRDFIRADVKKIIGLVEGERDESEWIGVFKLRDGRYASLRAGCDYTGWD